MRYFYSLIFLLAFTASFGQTSWIKKNGPLGGEVTDVEYYPGTSTVWALVDGDVYKSGDDGVSWEQPANTQFDGTSIYDIEIANNTIYFLAYDQVFTSIDQGTSIVAGTKGQFFNGLKIKVLPVSKSLVILSGNGSTDIYYSTNNGTNWTAGYNAPTINTEYLAVNSVDQIFILVRNGSFYRPYRSTDGGATFTEQSGTGSVVTASVDVFSITASPDGNQVACVTGTGIFTTTTGASWSFIKGGAISDAAIASFGGKSFVEYTGDNNGMYFMDNQNHKLYAKTTAGAASSWVLQTSNFPIASSALWPSASVNILTSLTFPAVSSKVVFGTTLGIFRSATGGASTPETNSGISHWYSNKTIATADGSLLMATYDGGLLYSAAGSLSVPAGDSWTRVTSVPFSVNTITNVVTGTVPSMGMSQVVLGSDGKAYYSSNDGSSWSASTQTGTFTDLQGGDNKRCFGYTSAGIYYSADGGALFSAAIAMTGSLPASYSINDLYVPTSASVIYLNITNFSAGSINQYYKVAMTYNGSNGIMSAVASLMTSPSLTGSTSTYASNGKLYVYKSSTDQLTIYNGTSWSTPTTLPDASRLFIASNNGYIFILQNGTTAKVLLSRDDGANFTATNLPTGFSASNVQDVTVSPQGYVFLSQYKDFMYQSKTKVVLPVAPSGFTEVARLGNAFIFRWTDNASDESATRVYRSSDGGTNYSLIGTIDNSATCGADIGGRNYFTDNTVVAGTTYKYKVRVVNDAGETESAVFSPAAIPAVSTPTVPDNRAWTAQNAGGGGYSVQPAKTDVCIQSLGNGKYLVSDIVMNLFFTSDDVPQEFYVNGTTTAVGGSDTGSSSTSVKANGTNTWNGSNILKLSWTRCDDVTKTETITYTLQANAPTPAQPVLQAVATNSTTIELTWPTVNFTKNYILERSTTSASSGFTQLGSDIPYPTALITDNTVVEGTTYYYRLKARNANSTPLESPYSDVVTIVFKKPNFIVSATTISSYVSTTLGSFWADFDNDGNDDLMTVNGSLDGATLATVTIFKNLGNGDFEKKDVTLGTEAYTFGAVADINGDGKMDISVTVADKAQVDFFKGNGDFTFTKFTGDELGPLDTAVKSERQGLMWGDVNNDGRLDVVLSGEYNPTLDDRLLLCIQNDNGTFSPSSAGELGSFADDSFSTFWIDYNNDGYTDMLVSGTDPLRLYKNNGDNTFHLLSSGESGIALGGFGGLTVADFNNDGFMDIFCGGGEGSSSVIYQNDGDGTFTLNDGTAVTEAAFVISPAAGDINNDGRVDLIVPGFFGLPTKMYINTSTGGTLSFNTITTEKINDNRYWHLGTALGDYNKDGFLDVGMGSLKNIGGDDDFIAGENYLFKNNNATGNWLQLNLVGVTANKNGLGARVTLTAGGKTYAREVASSSAFISLNSLTQHFGLGSASTITSLEVKWPTTPPAVQVIPVPAINTIVTITQDTYPPEISSRVPIQGATGVVTSTKIEITFNENTVAVGGKNIEIVPTDGGATINIDVGTGVVNGKKITFTLPQQLIANKHYDITIEAGSFMDQFQNKTALMTDWGFTTSDADPEAPVFGNVASVIPATVNKDALALELDIPVTDNKGVTSASLFIKSVSGTSVEEIEAESSDISSTGVHFTLPATAFDATGVQYYFTAKDQAGNEAVSKAPPDVYQTLIKYTGSDATIPASLVGSGGTVTGWKVIAIPFDLGSNNGVQTVFDELTGTVKVDYRIVTYTETPSPDWQDYPDKFSTVDRGVGYFINVKTPVNIVVGDGLVAPSNTRKDLFKLNLKAGWNMIGNPYLEPISWDDVVTLNSISGTGTTMKKFSGGSYSNGTTLAAYEGGFVHMDADAEVGIPFNGQTSSGRIAKTSFGPGEWLIPIAVHQGEFTNNFGGVGMHSDASLSFDALDDINAPRWFDFLEMNFKHPEHNAKTFARDVVPVASEFEWSFEFDSNIPGAATMTWDAETYVIESDLYLYDEDTQTPVDMKEVNSYSFDASVSRNFGIFYGPDALSKMKPQKVMLGLAHPNPTSDVATIGFSIPETKGKMNVRLDVFDLTGRKVGTLVNGEFEAGFYSTQWQPQEAAMDGMYVYRLFAGDEVLGGKIILRK